MNGYFVSRSSCPGCGSRNFVEFYRTSYATPPISDYLTSFYSPQGGVEFDLLEGSDYTLDECRDCGLVFQGEIPGQTLSLKLYEEWIDPHKSFELYEARRCLSYFLGLTNEIANLIEQLDMPPSGVRVLDFGMGWGYWCRAASGLGCEAYGVDLSPTRLENATRRGIQVLQWAEIPDHKFDLINADQVFEHIPDPFDAMSHLQRALKPGGLMKVSVPDGVNAKRNLALGDWTAPAGSPRSLNPVAPLEHINTFTMPALLTMARRAALRQRAIPGRLLVVDSPVNLARNFGSKVIRAVLGPSVGRTPRTAIAILLESSP